MTITLEWDSETSRVWVRCEDDHPGDQPLLCYTVEPREARFAFLHPFAAGPLHEPRSLEGGPIRYASDHRSDGPSVNNHARTPDSDHVASLDVTDETENTTARRRRWYHLRSNRLRHIDLTQLEYPTWWPL